LPKPHRKAGIYLNPTYAWETVLESILGPT
jgi:hypothetical protein